MTQNIEDRVDTLAGKIDHPKSDGKPVFNTPWQARAFALAIVLQSQDNLHWNDFQGRLVEEIQFAESGNHNEKMYYMKWISALERTICEKEIVDVEELENRIGEFESGERDASEFVIGADHNHDHNHEH
jgi:nitrile hydratase accessory protein